MAEKAMSIFLLRPWHKRDIATIEILCREVLLLDSFADRIPTLLHDEEHHGIVAVDSENNASATKGDVIGACVVSLDQYAACTSTTSRANGTSGGTPREGFVDLLVVSSAWQGRGVGKQLLLAAEEHLQTLGCEVVRVIGNPPHYAWSGVDVRYLKAICLFEAMNYQRGHATLNLSVDLRRIELENPIAEQEIAQAGIALRRATPQDVAWLRDELSPIWKSRWVDQAASVITDAVGRRAECGVHLAVSGRRCVGFCAWGVNRPNEVGPLGVHAGFRGIGLGEALLRQCCRDQSRLGLASAELQWAGPLEFFSRKLQAETSRVFFTYVKFLPSETI
jgi:mycothiol synthase